MKLNNKGFAFSTMLYGTLAIITLVLYAILNISKSSTDTTYYYGDVIKNKLNECIYDEIQLENCHSSSSTTCDSTSYHACLGVSDTPSFMGIIASEKLKESVVTTGDGLYEFQIENSPKKYVFKGSSVNNYIQYSGKLWRIVSVESNGSLKLIDYSNPLNVKWDGDKKGDNLEFNNSTISSNLNLQYFSEISDKSKIMKSYWESILIYTVNDSANDEISLNDYYTVKSQQMEQINANSNYVGLLSIEDYMNASLISHCQDNLLNASSCVSWLSEYKGWTINLHIDKGKYATGDNAAYYFGDNGTNQSQKDKIISEDVESEMAAYPVIYLNRNISINGEGTLTNPYIVQ